jgi:V8-like Glu-specific endopeptidase
MNAVDQPGAQLYVSEGVEPPLTLDELATHRDVVATKPMPDELLSALERPTLTVTVGDWNEALELSSETGPNTQGGQLTLPPEAFIGAPVSEMELHETGSLGMPKSPPEPHRPSWQTLSRFPRLTTVPERFMRRKKGTKVMLTDSGHIYGEYPPRQPFYPSGYPWQCIGRLFVWSDATLPNWSSWGSATLVGDRSILTAGHMVPWGSNGRWKALFVAGYYDGTSVAGRGAQSWVTSAHGYNPNNQVVAHDMAVMRLANPLGSSLGYFGTKAYHDNWEGGRYWTLVGYPSAVTSERPSYQASIAVLDDDEDGNAQELEHHGDDTGGDSGGPFFGWWAHQPYTIGTVSGYEVIGGFLGIGDEDNNIVAGGPDLNALVAYARQHWPK